MHDLTPVCVSLTKPVSEFEQVDLETFVEMKWIQHQYINGYEAQTFFTDRKRKQEM